MAAQVPCGNRRPASHDLVKRLSAPISKAPPPAPKSKKSISHACTHQSLPWAQLFTARKGLLGQAIPPVAKPPRRQHAGAMASSQWSSVGVSGGEMYGGGFCSLTRAAALPTHPEDSDSNALPTCFACVCTSTLTAPPRPCKDYRSGRRVHFQTPCTFHLPVTPPKPISLACPRTLS